MRHVRGASTREHNRLFHALEPTQPARHDRKNASLPLSWCSPLMTFRQNWWILYERCVALIRNLFQAGRLHVAVRLRASASFLRLFQRPGSPRRRWTSGLPTSGPRRHPCFSQPDGVGRDRAWLTLAAVGVAETCGHWWGAPPPPFVLVPGVPSGVAFYGSLVLGHPLIIGSASWRPRSFSSSFLDRGECGSSTDRLGGRGPGGVGMAAWAIYYVGVLYLQTVRQGS